MLAQAMEIWKHRLAKTTVDEPQMEDVLTQKLMSGALNGTMTDQPRNQELDDAEVRWRTCLNSGVPGQDENN